MLFIRYRLLYILIITVIIFYPVIRYLVLDDYLSINVLAQVTQPQDKFIVEKNQSNSKLDNSKSDTTLVSTQIAAATTIIAAALTGFLTIINQRKIASLDIQKIKESARTTYEYESRKRLYEQCEPILFQLVESSDYALYRIRGLARETREGRLKPNEGHLSDPDSYYMKTTIYRLIAPMAAFRILQSQLTLIDLSLDSRISIQYDIAKAIYRTFSADYDLAKSGLELDYRPERKGLTIEEREQLRGSKPAIYVRQAIFAGILEKLVSDLIIYDERIKKDRVMRYGEFEEKFFNKETAAWEDNEELKTIVKRLLNFQPNTRPVLWRILITQALLYDSLKNIREHDGPPYIKRSQWMMSDEKKLFDWRQNTIEATDEVLIQPFIAAEKYLQNQEERLYDKLVNGI